MLINSLAALALGFALDMLLGDPEVVVYPQYFIKKLVAKLDKSFRNSYKNTPEAQRMAGLMMTVIVLLVVAAVALLLLFVGYKLNAALGIFLEGIMCWSALSVKSLKTAAGGVMRAARAGNLSSAQRKVKKVTFRDTDDMNIDAVIKSTVESVAENTTDWVVAPYINFGKFPAKLDDVLSFIPARIAALLMKMNVSYLHLDSKNASQVYKKDRRKSPSPNSAQTQSVCAGALGIQLGSDEYYGGQLVRKPVIGRNLKPCEPNDLFWANQLLLGTSFYAMLFTAVIRTALFFVI